MRLPRVVPKDGPSVFHCFNELLAELCPLDSEEREKLQNLISKHADFCGMEILSAAVMENGFQVILRVNQDPEVSEEEALLRFKALHGENHREFRKLCQHFNRTGTIPSTTLHGLRARMGNVSIFLKELKEGFAKWFNRRHERKGCIWIDSVKNKRVLEGTDEALMRIGEMRDQQLTSVQGVGSAQRS